MGKNSKASPDGVVTAAKSIGVKVALITSASGSQNAIGPFLLLGESIVAMA